MRELDLKAIARRWIAEGWLWRLVAAVAWAVACGVVCAALHREPWNRPVHWINIGWMFAAFPAALAAAAFLERSYVRTSLQAAGISFGFLGGFLYEDCRRTGRFFDDVAVILLFGAGYLVPALIATRFLRRSALPSPDIDVPLGAAQFDLRTMFVATTLSAVVIPAVMQEVVWLSVASVYLCWILLVVAFGALRFLKRRRLTSGETIILCTPLYVAAILAIYRYSIAPSFQ